MNVHPRNQQAPRHVLQVFLQGSVSLLGGHELLHCFREGMSRGGDNPETVFGRHFGNRFAQVTQVFARFADVLADPRTHLDLALQKFPGYLGTEFLAQCRHQFFGHLPDQVTGFWMHQQILLFNSQGKRRRADHFLSLCLFDIKANGPQFTPFNHELKRGLNYAHLDPHPASPRRLINSLKNSRTRRWATPSTRGNTLPTSRVPVISAV